jgi:hypothetical protein
MTEASLLGPGERCIWSGKPDAVWFALRRLCSHGFFYIAFLAIGMSLIASVFASFPNPTDGHPQANPHFDPFIVLVPLCLAAVGWLWLRGARTKYLLTNRRLVIDTLGPFANCISVPLEHVRFIELRSRVLSPGDLIFLETGRRNWDWGFKDDGFIAIADATRVERLLREAIDQTFSTRSRGPSQ